MYCVMPVLWQHSIKFKLIVLGSVEKKIILICSTNFLMKRDTKFQRVGKKHQFVYILVYCQYILSDWCHTSTIFLWDAYYFFCYIQNSFCHAFNLLCHGYNLFCYSNYSPCDIHYFQCCALNFLSVVHNSANTHCNFGVVVPPTWFTAS